ncbi:inner membrane protein [Enterobacterales bacterium]|nr:inner membrane protein [Enterobacterales bacterium]
MTLAPLFVLCRFVHFASLMQIFGICVMVTLLAPRGFSTGLLRQNERLLALSACLAALTSIGMLAIQAGLMGNGWQDCLNLNVWLLVLTTTFGEVWRWHLLLTAVVLMVCLMEWLPGRAVVLLFTSIALLLSLAFIGHAAMHQGLLGMVQRSNHALHLLSAAYWFGSLVPLLWCLHNTQRQDVRPNAITTLIRFSTCGHVAVGLVIITGIINSVIILQRWPTDFSSLYQMLLLVKIVLVVGMVGVALYNRYKLVPLIVVNPQLAHRRMISAIWLEIALSLTVLLLVSGFATLAPR